MEASAAMVDSIESITAMLGDQSRLVLERYITDVWYSYACGQGAGIALLLAETPAVLPLLLFCLLFYYCRCCCAIGAVFDVRSFC